MSTKFTVPFQLLIAIWAKMTLMKNLNIKETLINKSH